MNQPLVWTELILMPTTPRREPQALVDVADTEPRGRLAVISSLAVDGLKRQIEDKYARLKACAAKDDEHLCVSVSHMHGQYSDGVAWSRLMLMYERRCFRTPEELEDFFHNTANWLNIARSLQLSGKT